MRCLIFRLGQWETFVCDMHICIDMIVKDDRNKWFPTCNFTYIRFLGNFLCSHYTLCFTLFTSTGAAIFKRNVSPWFPRRCRIRKVPLRKMVWCEPVKRSGLLKKNINPLYVKGLGIYSSSISPITNVSFQIKNYWHKHNMLQ